MVRVSGFEDLEAWQCARRLARDLYRVSSTGELAADFILRNQLRRAAISVLSNIAEGFERDGNPELIQFLSIAKGSAGELRSQLFIVSDCGYVSSKQFAELYALAKQVSGKLDAPITYLRRSGMTGRKFQGR